MARFERRSSFLGAAVIAVLFCGTATAAAPAAHAALSGKQLAAEVIAETNTIREAAGCSPVEADEQLRSVAQEHASDIARRGDLEHVDQDGTTSGERISTAGYDDSYGENLASGYTTAAEVMDAWMSSAGHRENIEECAFTAIGVGYAPNGHYWVQDFGG
jgi:uncharacterized protein YkwD